MAGKENLDDYEKHVAKKKAAPKKAYVVPASTDIFANRPLVNSQKTAVCH
jgi:hypothetical protein